MSATTTISTALISRHLARSLSALVAATLVASLLNAFALLILIVVSSLIPLALLDLVNGSLSPPFAPMLLVAASIENFVEFPFIDLFAPAFLDLLLERVDLLDVLPLLAVSLRLLVGLDRLVELFVLHARLLLLESLDLALLLQQPRFHLGHVLVRFEHLSEEIIWTADWDLGLHQDFHTFLHIFTCHIVKSDLAFDVIVHRQCLWHLQGLVIGDGHVLREGDAALGVVNKLLR